MQRLSFIKNHLQCLCLLPVRKCWIHWVCGAVSLLPDVLFNHKHEAWHVFRLQLHRFPSEAPHSHNRVPLKSGYLFTPLYHNRNVISFLICPGLFAQTFKEPDSEISTRICYIIFIFTLQEFLCKDQLQSCSALYFLSSQIKTAKTNLLLLVFDLSHCFSCFKVEQNCNVLMLT